MQTSLLSRPTIHLPRRPLLALPARPVPQQTCAPDRLQLHSVESAALLSGRKVVEITHHGAVYRLSATRLGKLILTK